MTDFYNFIEQEFANQPFKIGIVRLPKSSEEQYQVEVSIGWSSQTKYNGQGITITSAIIECLKDMKSSGDIS